MVLEVVTTDDLARLILFAWPVNMTTAPVSKLDPRNVTLPCAPAAMREGTTPAKVGAGITVRQRAQVPVPLASETLTLRAPTAAPRNTVTVTVTDVEVLDTGAAVTPLPEILTVTRDRKPTPEITTLVLAV
jgi:hypothetical protein